ncbi:MAG TPA: type II toxin-antitoxin system RelE/ParE family toxin [Candidatus Nanoarchaeia archaeon]|nr:type II toxin-antitoxin system RelE/ParE family toxin [Candidatus Nanoarchaeia archaeon]
MIYTLLIEKTALDYLNKLEKETKERIWNKLQQCKENPFHFLEHLEEIKGFKLRVGDYRLIIDVNNESKILHVLKIGHRKNIYED